MRRLPVVATIRDAYLFAFTHLGSVIGLIWVPMVLLAVMGFFSLQRYYNAVIDVMAGGTAAVLGPALLVMLGYIVAALLLQAVIYVAVVQLALGARSGTVLAHFAFGPLEWRMFRAFLALAGLVLVFVVPALLIGSVLVQASSGHMPQIFALLLFQLFVLVAVLVPVPRFLTMLPAIAVAEAAPVLRRGWALSAGNFWRLLAVLLAVFGPVLVLLRIAEALLARHAPAAVAGGSAQVQLLASMVRARELLPLVSGLGFAVSPLLVGLFAGASVSAWRALKDNSTDIVA
jgi:hypothetical protein